MVDQMVDHSESLVQIPHRQRGTRFPSFFCKDLPSSKRICKLPMMSWNIQNDTYYIYKYKYKYM